MVGNKRKITIWVWASDFEAAVAESERLASLGDDTKPSGVLRRWIRRGRLQEQQARESRDG